MFVNFNILNQLGSPAINSNTFANRPAAGQTGRLFVSTDTFEIYRDNGTSWDLIGGPGTSTITGTGTATQVAYFTSSQAIGSSANLFWDNTNGYLGVGTATPGARIEAVKTDGYGIYANYTTNVGSGASTTAIYAINNTAGSGYAAVIEEKTGNTTGGQYPLLVKHSLSSGTAAVGNGTGLQFQLQDDAGTFKTTQLTIETIDAAAATYATRYRFNVQSAGSSTPAAYLNATGLGLGTATPGAKLDIHSTGTLAQFNSTGTTNNAYLAIQRAGATIWRLGDTYNSGSNFFGIYNSAISTNAIAISAATNKTEFSAVETYSTGVARGNYFDYNLSVAAGASFSSPNAITALGASLDLTLAGNATIPSGARTGLDAYNSVSFTGAGTLTMTQGTQIRPYSNVTTGWAFNGSATGTITHLAGLRVLFPDNSGSAVSVTNNYGLLINDQSANTGTVTYTNRWGIYQEGASDLNYFAANTLIGTTTNNGSKLQVNGDTFITSAGSTELKVDGTNPFIKLIRNNNGNASCGINFEGNVAVKWQTGTNQAVGLGYEINEGNATNNRLYIAPGGAATFSSSLQATAMSIGVNPTANILVVRGENNNNDGTIQIGIRGFLQHRDAGNTITSLANDYNSDSAQMQFRMKGNSSSDAKMTILGSGLVGIGTSTPSTTLQVDSSSGGIVRVSRLSAGAAIFQIEADGTNGTISATNATIFNTASTERARITTGGNFLIGTTTDAGQKLQVNGSGSFTGTVTSSDLSLGANYSNTYTTDATWSTATTIIPTNTLNVNAVYLIKLKWVTTAGASPYNCNTAFLICPANCNGGGADNTVTAIISTHQGGTGTLVVNMRAGSGQVSAGLQVALTGFANLTGSLDVTATALKT